MNEIEKLKSFPIFENSEKSCKIEQIYRKKDTGLLIKCISSNIDCDKNHGKCHFNNPYDCDNDYSVCSNKKIIYIKKDLFEVVFNTND